MQPDAALANVILTLQNLPFAHLARYGMHADVHHNMTTKWTPRLSIIFHSDPLHSRCNVTYPQTSTFSTSILSQGYPRQTAFDTPITWVTSTRLRGQCLSAVWLIARSNLHAQTYWISIIMISNFYSLQLPACVPQQALIAKTLENKSIALYAIRINHLFDRVVYNLYVLYLSSYLFVYFKCIRIQISLMSFLMRSRTVRELNKLDRVRVCNKKV